MTTRTDAAGRTLALDPVRRRYVVLTPEEAVRQRLLADLLSAGYPPGLLAVEKGLVYNGMPWRADVVAHDRAGGVLLLAECKRPTVALTQATFDQLARYNAALGARVLVADNGGTRLVLVAGSSGWVWADALPPFHALAGDAA